MAPTSSFVPDPKVLPVVRQLFLLEFTPLEMLQSVTQAAGTGVTLGDVEDHIKWLYSEWEGGPELQAINRAEGSLWARSEMFRHDLLGLYADQLANARATMQGDFNHADGRPVIKTKPAEVVSTAEKILSMERSVITEQRQALLRLGQAASGSPVKPEEVTPRFSPVEAEEEWEVSPPVRTDL